LFYADVILFNQPFSQLRTDHSLHILFKLPVRPIDKV